MIKEDYSINFFSEETDFSLQNENEYRLWIERIFKEEKLEIGYLNFIFCSDEYLLEINLKYLDHNYYTDIITFDQSEEENILAGDIFISVDRAKSNSNKLNISLKEEILRLISHGILHLSGYKDKTEKEQKEMTHKEDYCLSLWTN